MRCFCACVCLARRLCRLNWRRRAGSLCPTLRQTGGPSLQRIRIRRAAALPRFSILLRLSVVIRSEWCPSVLLRGQLQASDSTYAGQFRRCRKITAQGSRSRPHSRRRRRRLRSSKRRPTSPAASPPRRQQRPLRLHSSSSSSQPAARRGRRRAPRRRLLSAQLPLPLRPLLLLRRRSRLPRPRRPPRRRLPRSSASSLSARRAGQQEAPCFPTTHLSSPLPHLAQQVVSQ